MSQESLEDLLKKRYSPEPKTGKKSVLGEGPTVGMQLMSKESDRKFEQDLRGFLAEADQKKKKTPEEEIQDILANIPSEQRAWTERQLRARPTELQQAIVPASPAGIAAQASYTPKKPEEVPTSTIGGISKAEAEAGKKATELQKAEDEMSMKLTGRPAPRNVPERLARWFGPQGLAYDLIGGVAASAAGKLRKGGLRFYSDIGKVPVKGVDVTAGKEKIKGEVSSSFFTRDYVGAKPVENLGAKPTVAPPSAARTRPALPAGTETVGEFIARQGKVPTVVPGEIVRKAPAGIPPETPGAKPVTTRTPEGREVTRVYSPRTQTIIEPKPTSRPTATQTVEVKPFAAPSAEIKAPEISPIVRATPPTTGLSRRTISPAPPEADLPGPSISFIPKDRLFRTFPGYLGMDASRGKAPEEQPSVEFTPSPAKTPEGKPAEKPVEEPFEIPTEKPEAKPESKRETKPTTEPTVTTTTKTTAEPTPQPQPKPQPQPQPKVVIPLTTAAPTTTPGGVPGVSPSRLPAEEPEPEKQETPRKPTPAMASGLGLQVVSGLEGGERFGFMKPKGPAVKPKTPKPFTSFSNFATASLTDSVDYRLSRIDAAMNALLETNLRKSQRWLSSVERKREKLKQQIASSGSTPAGRWESTPLRLKRAELTPAHDAAKKAVARAKESGRKRKDQREEDAAVKDAERRQEGD